MFVVTRGFEVHGGQPGESVLLRADVSYGLRDTKGRLVGASLFIEEQTNRIIGWMSATRNGLPFGGGKTMRHVYATLELAKKDLMGRAQRCAVAMQRKAEKNGGVHTTPRTRGPRRPNCMVCHDNLGGVSAKAGPSLTRVLFEAGKAPLGTELMILYCGNEHCKHMIECGEWEAKK